MKIQRVDYDRRLDRRQSGFRPSFGQMGMRDINGEKLHKLGELATAS